jgi:hypothetical protein
MIHILRKKISVSKFVFKDKKNSEPILTTAKTSSQLIQCLNKALQKYTSKKKDDSANLLMLFFTYFCFFS